MSTGLLYHACGLRGYVYQPTDYEGGKVIFTIHQPRASLRCPVYGSDPRHVFARRQVRREFRSLPIGSKPTRLRFAVLADFSGYVAADELYDGPFYVLSIVGNRTFRWITYEVLDHDPTHPDIERFFRLLRSIPVNRTGRDTAATRAALRALDRGDVLGIFPEGRINTTGRGLLDPRPGVALIALRRRVPVIPAYIEGAPVGKTMIQPFFKRANVHVTYGRPIDLSEYHDGEKNREVLQEVSARFMSAIARLSGVEDRWRVGE